MEKYIVVIGSKPNLKLPVANVDWVFSANGAAEKGQYFCDKLKILNHTCVVGTREFEKNEEVSKRVLKANLKEIVFRYGKLSEPKFKFDNYTKVINFSKYKQFIFQKKFFTNSTFDLLYSEIFYKNSLYKRILYFIHCLTRKGFLCSSTGLFSILYALEIFPNHKIIISGIGPTQDTKRHYYDNFTNYESRAQVDDILFQKIKIEYKERLISTDNELSNKYNLIEWHEETFL